MDAKLKDAAAGVVIVAFVGLVAGMLWEGRSPDSLLLVVMLALVLAAGYRLWGSSMDRGVDAASDLADGDDGGDGE